MYPDGLMPIQGTTLHGAAAPAKTLRTVVLVTALAGLAVMATSARYIPRPTAMYTMSECPRCEYRGAAMIIELCRIGRADEAVSLADSYLSRPGLPPMLQSHLYFLRAGALRLLGRDSESNQDYGYAAKISAADNDPQDQMELLAQAGEFSAAADMARQVLRDKAGDPYAVNNACWELTLYPAGDPAEAERLMQPIASQSQDAAWIDTHAWSLYRSGRTREAAAEEQRAIDNIGPEEAWHAAYYHACLVGMQGDTARARRELDRIFQDDILFTSAWTAAQRFSTH
ncbi:MAG: hypothetical protein LC772_07050 [Chloroflexi bacterium]|nr:hypothetical protein [Chloroflexota bacterium]